METASSTADTAVGSGYVVRAIRISLKGIGLSTEFKEAQDQARYFYQRK
jgi:hypothetical protein